MWYFSFMVVINYTPAIAIFYCTTIPTFMSRFKNLRFLYTKSKWDILFTSLIFISILGLYVSLYFYYSEYKFIVLIFESLMLGVSMYYFC